MGQFVKQLRTESPRLTATQSEVAVIGIASSWALPATLRRGARVRRVTRRATTSYDVAARDVTQNALPATSLPAELLSYRHACTGNLALGRG